MKRICFLFIGSFFFLTSFSQLKDIKIIIPKEIGYSYSDFAQFFPGEKYFVVCANSLSVFNTETAEVIDEYDLPYGAKNLSLSADGNYILVSINNELWVFTFKNQRIELFLKTTTSELIKGQPQSEYYGSLPIAGCFFTNKPNEVYVSIGSFTLIYDIQKKLIVTSYAFPIADYVLHASYYIKKNEAVLAKTTGTISVITKQSLSDLSKTSEVIQDPGSIYKIRVHDSLLFCFSSNKYFVVSLENNKVLHEIRLPKYDYSNLYDKKTYADINKRPALSIPDTINFASNEYIYDMDFVPGINLAAYSTTKGVKFFDLKTKKIVRQYKGFFGAFKFSSNSKRMVCNSYTPYRALRVFDPTEMKLISERPAMGNAITSADISPNKRWLFTNGGVSGFFLGFEKFFEVC